MPDPYDPYQQIRYFKIFEIYSNSPPLQIIFGFGHEILPARTDFQKIFSDWSHQHLQFYPNNTYLYPALSKHDVLLKGSLLCSTISL